MKLSLSWIKDYVSLPDDADLTKLAYDLTMDTVEVEDVEYLGKRFENMVVGVITAVNPHPNADKLRVCTVDLGEAARRVYADASRGEVETYKDEADARAQLSARAANEDKRYEELYGIHYFDFNNYNLILDSSFLPPDRIADALIGEARACDVWDGYDKTGRILVSPKRLGAKNAAEVTYEHGYVYPVSIKVSVDGDRFTVTEGAQYVEMAAEEGYAYLSAVLA